MKPVLRDPLWAALPENHVLLRNRKVDFADIAHQPFVLFPARQGPSLYAAIERACYAHGAQLTVAAHAPRIHTQLSLVAGGLGVTLVPATARSIRVQGVRYRQIKNLPESLFLEMAIFYYESRKQGLLQAFISEVVHENYS